MVRLDWLEKLQHLLQTLAFCLTVATLQYALQAGKSYEVSLVYSLCIGVSIWLLIDFGRHVFDSARTHGWPAGPAGWLLPVAGIAGGFVVGTWLADRYFGWSSWDMGARAQLPISILITAMAGSVASYHFYSRSKRAVLALHMQQARQQASQAQLKVLQTQLDPHLLFNTLANLRALIGIDPPAAVAMLDRLDAYLRATLSASRATEHSLSQEFARLEDYLEIMKVRMGPRLRYALDLPPELGNVPVPTLLLQPMVENAIRHGLEPQLEGGEVQVAAQLDSSTQPPRLQLRVQDSGVGMSIDHMDALQTEGFGWTQLRERLFQRYGPASSVEVHAVPTGGTQVNITFAVDTIKNP